MAAVIKVSKESLKKVDSVIRKGGLVAFPAETVYCLGACAFNLGAVAEIFEVKRRLYPSGQLYRHYFLQTPLEIYVA